MNRLPPAERTTVAVIAASSLEAESLVARLNAEFDLEATSLAGQPDQAVDTARRARADVVVLDTALFSDAGAGAVGALRSRPRPPNVVALLSDDALESSVRLVEAGAIGVVLKSGSTADLVDSVRQSAKGLGWLSPRLLRTVLNRLATRPAPPVDGRLAVLTEREREVLALMVEGLDRRQIAERLYVSVETVRTHTRSVVRKLGVESTLAAAAVAREAGMSPRSGRALAS